MRVLTLRKGVEEEEFGRFLQTVTRARHLSADASDDLLTLLWEQDFQKVTYQFAEVISDPVGLRPAGARPAGPAVRERRCRSRSGRKWQSAKPEGHGRPRGLRLDALLPRRDRNRRAARPGRAGIRPRRPYRRAGRHVRHLRAPAGPRYPRGNHRRPRDRCSRTCWRAAISIPSPPFSASCARSRTRRAWTRRRTSESTRSKAG